MPPEPWCGLNGEEPSLRDVGVPNPRSLCLNGVALSSNEFMIRVESERCQPLLQAPWDLGLYDGKAGGWASGRNANAVISGGTGGEVVFLGGI